MRTRSLLIGLALLAPQLAMAQVFVAVPGVRVNAAPPALQVEVQSVAPSPQHIWIGGHWTWRGGQHVWAPGVWVVPPNPGWKWESARWVSSNGAWLFYEGHWKHGSPPQKEVVFVDSANAGPVADEIIIDQAPPPLMVEQRPARPFPSAVWIAGYWAWQGNRHNWVAGYWESPRGKDWLWDAHHWQPEAGRWRFVPGRWRHVG